MDLKSLMGWTPSSPPQPRRGGAKRRGGAGQENQFSLNSTTPAEAAPRLSPPRLRRGVCAFPIYARQPLPFNPPAPFCPPARSARTTPDRWLRKKSDALQQVSVRQASLHYPNRA